MSDNSQKTPFARAMNRFAEGKARDAIAVLGKALPCSVASVAGSIVTVAFDLANIPFTLPNVTCPMFGPEYIRYPTQVGDLGIVFSIDTYLGGISGLGGGTADLTLQANLSSLVFFPVASSKWSATENANAVVIYGPDGTIIRNTAKTASLSVLSEGATLTLPATKKFAVSRETNVAERITSLEEVVANLGVSQVALSTHTHSGVQAGGSNSGPPNPGT